MYILLSIWEDIGHIYNAIIIGLYGLIDVMSVYMFSYY
jgi:hypothetical protein